LTLLTAMMGDKDVVGTVAALAASGALAGARVICTSIEGGRAMPADDLAAIWRRQDPTLRVETVTPVAAAIEAAIAQPRGPVVVAGSLYLVGAVRGALVDDPMLRDLGEGAS
jgi:folylpolyglutamate synthase/dihydropteroate synthase